MRLQEVARIVGEKLSAIECMRIPDKKGYATVWWAAFEWTPDPDRPERVIRGNGLYCSKDPDKPSCPHILEAELRRTTDFIRAYQQSDEGLDAFLVRMRQAADRELERRFRFFKRALEEFSQEEQQRLRTMLTLYWGIDADESWVGQPDSASIDPNMLLLALNGEVERSDFSLLRRLADQMESKWLSQWHVSRDPLCIPNDLLR